MVQSRSDLTREAIRRGLTELVGEGQVCVDEEKLKASSVDRFKKYQAVNGIFTGPVPAAIVSVTSTEEVVRVLRFANEHLINVVPRTGITSTEGGLETIVEDTLVVDGSPMHKIVAIDPVNMMVTAQCGACLEVRGGCRPPAGSHDGPLTPVEAFGPDGRPYRNPLHRAAVDSVRRDRGDGRRPRGRLPRRHGLPHQERAAQGRRARHQAHRHRQRGRPVLHHRGHAQAVSLQAREQPVQGVPGRQHGRRDLGHP